MPSSLLEPDFSDPYTQWSTNQNPQTTSALLKSVDPVLTAALRSYGGQNSPTMKSKAKVMALDAMKRYDPTKAKLRTHLMSQLQGLRRASARESQILAVPEQVALDSGHLRESENFLRDQHGRDPSDSELADHTGLSLKRITYIRRARPTYPEGSLVRPTEDAGDDSYAPPIKQRGSGGARQWQQMVYYDLDPKDQLIMEHTLGMHGKQVLANQDIAKKLGVSPGAVSQRKARIQQKLDMRDELGVI
jgi:RNA polymerase primary sigma factor